MAEVIPMQGTFYKIIKFNNKSFGIFVNRSMQVVDVREVTGYQRNQHNIKAPIFSKREGDSASLYYTIYGQPISYV